MSNSALVSYTKLSPCKTSPRQHRIDRITIHCFVGQVTAEQGADAFSVKAKQKSCQYVVAKDGRVALVVKESDRSWASSSSANDHRAITIETASDTTSPYKITDAALAALVDLITDVCKRNGISKTIWIEDKDKALAYEPAPGEAIYTLHKWFANKACPGPYIISKIPFIRDEVNRRLQPEAQAPQDPGVYLVKVKAASLNIRAGAGTNYAKTGEIKNRGVYTIVETKDGKGARSGWGKLKSGLGWISLDYTERV